MTLYRFDEVDETLNLLPMAARRALDVACRKLTLAAWQRLPIEKRAALVALGSEFEVDASKVLVQLEAAEPAATAIPSYRLPDAGSIPHIVTTAFEGTGSIATNVWSALSPLDRYALFKVAQRARPPRLRAAYDEIIGESRNSSHLSPGGGVRMVDVGAKPSTRRAASAESRVSMNAEAFEKLRANNPKGDVLGTARIAGIMAAKKTSELIPLCHPLALTKVDVQMTSNDSSREVVIVATVETVGPTGVEMEALTAASCAALTVYDMLKAFDKAMQMGPTKLLAKSGGRSGDYRSQEKNDVRDS